MSRVETLEIEKLSVEKEIGSPLLNGNMRVIKNVKVKLEVKVGDATISVDELMNLKQNSVVKLGRDAGDPVDLLLDGSLIAKGFLVAADDNFGIQISEIYQSND